MSNCVADITMQENICSADKQKLPSSGVLSKSCAENVWQIHKKTPMVETSFNKQLFSQNTTGRLPLCYRSHYVGKFVGKCLCLISFSETYGCNSVASRILVFTKDLFLCFQFSNNCRGY